MGERYEHEWDASGFRSICKLCGLHGEWPSTDYVMPECAAPLRQALDAALAERDAATTGLDAASVALAKILERLRESEAERDDLRLTLAGTRMSEEVAVRELNRTLERLTAAEARAERAEAFARSVRSFTSSSNDVLSELARQAVNLLALEAQR